MNFSMLGSARAASSNLNGLAEALQQTVVEVRSGETASGTRIIWGGAGLVVRNALPANPIVSPHLKARDRYVWYSWLERLPTGPAQ
jgi:hypothetical protein